MKKIFAILAAVMMLAFVSCGNSKKEEIKWFNCAICGRETKSGETIEYMGEKVDLCNKCAKAYEELLEEALGY